MIFFKILVDRYLEIAQKLCVVRRSRGVAETNNAVSSNRVTSNEVTVKNDMVKIETSNEKRF